jgi:hypothetical protein
MTTSARHLLVALLAVGGCATTQGEEPKHKAEEVSPLGKPEDFKAGQSARYAVWWDDGGWHVRTTTGAKGPHGFKGRIEIVGGKMVRLDPVAVEGKGAKRKEADTGTWNAQGTAFDFTLKTGAGHTDGFDLTVTGGATLIRFNLAVGGDEAPGKVFIGAKGEHPKGAVFYLPAHPKK